MVGGNSLALIDEIEPAALANLGYPIAEVEEDGSFVVTKAPNTPGVVSQATVKEQLLYEMHDPRAYITPDVVANLTTLRLADDGRGSSARLRRHRRPAHGFAQGEPRAPGGLQPRADLHPRLA